MAQHSEVPLECCWKALIDQGFHFRSPEMNRQDVLDLVRGYAFDSGCELEENHGDPHYI